MQGTHAIPLGCPNWDNANRNYWRKAYKHNRAWYSREYAQGLPRKAKKKLMRDWHESAYGAPEDFVLMPLAQTPICWEFQPHWIMRQCKYFNPRAGHFSPLAPPAERKRQLRAHKRLQKQLMGKPVLKRSF